MTETTGFEPGTSVLDPDEENVQTGTVVHPAALTRDELIDAIEANAGIAVIRFDGSGQLVVRVVEWLLCAD
jgi:hypothetical protein